MKIEQIEISSCVDDVDWSGTYGPPRGQTNIYRNRVVVTAMVTDDEAVSLFRAMKSREEWKPEPKRDTTPQLGVSVPLLGPVVEGEVVQEVQPIPCIACGEPASSRCPEDFGMAACGAWVCDACGHKPGARGFGKPDHGPRR